MNSERKHSLVFCGKEYELSAAELRAISTLTASELVERLVAIDGGGIRLLVWWLTWMLKRAMPEGHGADEQISEACAYAIAALDDYEPRPRLVGPEYDYLFDAACELVEFASCYATAPETPEPRRRANITARAVGILRRVCRHRAEVAQRLYMSNGETIAGMSLASSEIFALAFENAALRGSA